APCPSAHPFPPSGDRSLYNCFAQPRRHPCPGTHLAGLGRTLARPSHARESQVFGSPPAPQRPGPTRMTAPSGCRSKLESKYHRLCDLAEGWGIALETLAGVGAVATVAFMFALLILISKVQDANRRKMLPTQFLFLLGVFGVFGLTFAFLIKLDGATGPTRFFLFGVLFAICFSCLLAHTFNLNKLVRGRKPLSWLVILSLALGFSLVQDVIAIEYLVLTMNRTNTEVFSELPTSRRNEDFVMLLIYVLFLMALTFFSSFFVFCGSFPGWKRHGAHICCTSFLSIAVWVAWIVLLLIPDIGSEWDDTILCTALVANGWVFLAFYVFPEFLRLPRQQSPTDYPVEDAFCKPQLMKQSYGVENRAYSQEEITQGVLRTRGTRSMYLILPIFRCRIEVLRRISLSRGPMPRPVRTMTTKDGKGTANSVEKNGTTRARQQLPVRSPADAD
ncbi:Retinoic acid-induced protein 3, partial [Lemmus lemmus]